MIRFITKKLGYGLLVLMGVVVVVFFLFQGFGDPARLVLGQSGDSTTISNIKKELALDQPTTKQFLLYLNDVSPIGLYSPSEIESKKLRGYFIPVGDKQLGIKFPYLRRSYQSKKQVSEILLEAIPGTLLLAFAAMFVATLFGILLGMLAAIKKNTWMDSSAVFSSVLGISAPSFFMGIIIAYFTFKTDVFLVDSNGGLTQEKLGYTVELRFSQKDAINQMTKAAACLALYEEDAIAYEKESGTLPTVSAKDLAFPSMLIYVCLFSIFSNLFLNFQLSPALGSILSYSISMVLVYLVLWRVLHMVKTDLGSQNITFIPLLQLINRNTGIVGWNTFLILLISNCVIVLIIYIVIWYNLQNFSITYSTS